jgi:hypothetical protein
MCDNKQLKRKFEKREVAEKRRGRRERERGKEGEDDNNRLFLYSLKINEKYFILFSCTSLAYLRTRDVQIHY